MHINTDCKCIHTFHNILSRMSILDRAFLDNLVFMPPSFGEDYKEFVSFLRSWERTASLMPAAKLLGNISCGDGSETHQLIFFLYKDMYMCFLFNEGTCSGCIPNGIDKVMSDARDRIYVTTCVSDLVTYIADSAFAIDGDDSEIPAAIKGWVDTYRTNPDTCGPFNKNTQTDYFIKGYPYQK